MQLRRHTRLFTAGDYLTYPVGSEDVFWLLGDKGDYAAGWSHIWSRRNGRLTPKAGKRLFPIHHNVFSTTTRIVNGMTNRLIGLLRRYQGAPTTIAQYHR